MIFLKDINAFSYQIENKNWQTRLIWFFFSLEFPPNDIITCRFLSSTSQFELETVFLQLKMYTKKGQYACFFWKFGEIRASLILKFVETKFKKKRRNLSTPSSKKRCKFFWGYSNLSESKAPISPKVLRLQSARQFFGFFWFSENNELPKVVITLRII